mmetsp:Transcript_9276/g.17994  ORF Transcript_9276/g.17994 Transcript_9276/m.17994 type:complete len:296 (+) Transcript_9276:24-911(+)
MAEEQKGGKPAADSVDKMVCYEAALQPRPLDDVDFYLVAWGHSASGHPPRDPPQLMREDFSGSGMVSCGWVTSAPSRRSWAVDFDAEVHAWGTTHHLPKLTQDQRDRVSLVTCDVMASHENGVPPVDVVVGNNFSWQCWHQDEALEAYLWGVRQGLRPGGMLVLDAFGGTSISHDSYEEISNHDITLEDGRPARFSYVYEQMNCQAGGHMTIGVSFKFTDGSVMKHAFKYAWRVRPVGLVREAMLRVGFKTVCLFVDWNDDTGAYRHGTEPTDPQEWSKMCEEEEYKSCYIVAYA